MDARYVIIKTSISEDGLGCPSVSVFISLCDKKKVTGSFCKGCHNKELQSKEIGVSLYVDEVVDIIKTKFEENIKLFGRSCISIMGGEPLSKHNRDYINKVAENFKNHEIIVYTWRNIKQLKKEDINISNYSKIVCGEYRDDKKDENYILGSINQYVIDSNYKKIIHYKGR